MAQFQKQITIDNLNAKKKFQTFTPDKMVKEMLNLVDYRHNLYNKKVLEHSFGEGNFLVEIVRRYILDCFSNGYSKEKTSRGLQKDIIGFEIDPVLFARAKKKLDELALSYNLSKVNWSLFCSDFLFYNSELKFDYIIGNPPYLNYKLLDCETRKKIHNSFISCECGKFDYCYPFIEKSYTLLKNKGVLIQLIPSSLYKNVFGKKLRDLLLADVCKIWEYQGLNIFDSVLTSSSVILVKKNSKHKFLSYINVTHNISTKVVKSKLESKWVFIENKQEYGTKRFGDYYQASISVATLRNNIFVLDSRLAEKLKLETTIIKNAVSPRNLKSRKIIIFPYYWSTGNLSRYNEEEFKVSFPNAYQYLLSRKAELLNRDSDINAQWFEFGRSQSLNHLHQQKLLISTIYSKKITVFKLNVDDIPYSGIFIFPKDKKNSLRTAKKILTSKAFLEYANSIGTSINGEAKRITCKDVMNYRF